MLRISSNPLKKGMRLKLPEAWHSKILTFSQKETFPYDFIIEEIIEDKHKNEVYCICRSDRKEYVDKKMVLTENVIRYLLAERVSDSNEGLSFREYLPSEDSKILITNTKNPNEVVPAIFMVIPELVRLNHSSMICLNLIIKYINGDGFTSIGYYYLSSRNFTWKLIMHPDMTYMTDYERMFCDTLIHKSYVEKSCAKLISYLNKIGATEHAKLLAERAKTHDNSKISCEDEMHALSRIINDKTNLIDASEQLSQIKQDAIKLHWEHNRHHPEHFKTPIDMSKIDIMEMCCDWHARSTQYHTDFLDFVKKRQEKRFHFPDWMFAEIWYYCEILNSP